MRTINSLLESITPDMRTINRRNYASSLRSVLNDTSILLLSHIKPISQVKSLSIANGIFGNETYFEAPFDMSQDDVIQVDKCNKDRCECCTVWDRVKNFDVKSKRLYGFDIEYNNGYKYIRLDINASICNPCGSSETECLDNLNGHFDVFDGITGVYKDPTTFIIGDTSLAFKLNANGSIAWDTTVRELAGDEVLTLWVWVNKPHKLSAVKLKLGTNSDYDELIATKRHNGNTFIFGWNLLKFKLNNRAGLVSYPVTRATLSFEATNNPMGSSLPCTNGNCEPLEIKLNCLSIRKTDCFFIKYYSSNIFRNNVTGNSVGEIKDILKQGEYEIILDEQAYFIYKELILERLKFQNVDENADFDINYISPRVMQLINMYNKRNPSLVKAPQLKGSNFINDFRLYGW